MNVLTWLNPYKWAIAAGALFTAIITIYSKGYSHGKTNQQSKQLKEEQSNREQLQAKSKAAKKRRDDLDRRNVPNVVRDRSKDKFNRDNT